MSLLNEAQQQKLFKYVGRDAMSESGRNVEVLALFRSLKAPQRAAAFDDGVGISDLSLAQKNQVGEVCAALGRTGGGLAASPVRLRVLDEAGEDHTSIVLSFRDGSSHVFRFKSRPAPLRDPWSYQRNLVL